MSTDGRERLLDWSLDEVFIEGRDKDSMRAEIAQLTEEFLARGGEIEVIPYDPTAEILDRALNRQLLGFEGMTASRQEESNETLLDDDDLNDNFFEPYG